MTIKNRAGSILLFFSLLLAGCASVAPAKKVTLDLYVMSQCPYAVQVDKSIKPVLDKLGPAVELRRHFIGLAQDGLLASMHGESEVNGDLLEICAAKVDPAKYPDLLFCLNRNYKEIPNNFDACASEVKVDGDKIKVCASGVEGKKLLEDSFLRSKEKQMVGSPTIVINGKPYSGSRASLDLLRYLCSLFETGTAPEACVSIPAPLVINLTVLTDTRCKDCVVDPVVNSLKTLFPGLVEKKLDYGTPEGKTLYEILKGTEARMLPAFLLDREVTEDPAYPQISQWMIDIGDKKFLRTGAKFDPVDEKENAETQMSPAVKQSEESEQ